MKNKPKELLFTCKGDHAGMVIKGEVEREGVCGRMEFMLPVLGYFAVPRAGSRPQSYNQQCSHEDLTSPISSGAN